MANMKISQLEELAATPDNADLLEIVDMAPTPTSKKITWANIKAAVLTAVGKVNEAVGFTLSGGTTSKTLTVLADMTLNGYSGTTKALAGTDTASAMTPADVKAVLDSRLPTENLIGVPGGMGFGVGICPPANLPDGMVGMPGYDQLGSDNYGNYIYRDGSVMCYIPKFYYRIGHELNPTYGMYGVNSIDTKGVDTFANEAAANLAGYALPTAFINGGTERDGIFIDKYMASKNAWGSGFIASSLRYGDPISTHADHNPIADLTNCTANAYYECINAAKARDGVDGAAGDGMFFCAPREVYALLALLSLAHGQASSNTTYCAWYHATYNYPKGLNNNQAPVGGVISAADVDDNDLTYLSDGYGRCGKTGSGDPFAKTTTWPELRRRRRERPHVGGEYRCDLCGGIEEY